MMQGHPEVQGYKYICNERGSRPVDKEGFTIEVTQADIIMMDLRVINSLLYLVPAS
jgi:hypothetical protein